MSGRGLGLQAEQLINWSPLRAIKKNVVNRILFVRFRILEYLSLGNQNSKSKQISFSDALQWCDTTIDLIPLIASSVMSKKRPAGRMLSLLNSTDCRWVPSSKTVDESAWVETNLVDLSKVVGRKTALTSEVQDRRPTFGTTIGNQSGNQRSIGEFARSRTSGYYPL